MTSSFEYRNNDHDDQLRHVPIRKSGDLNKKKRPDYVRKRQAVRRGIKLRRNRRIQW